MVIQHLVISHLGIVQIDIYHLVMTNSLPWKVPPFLIGKASISTGLLYHGYVESPEGIYIYMVYTGHKNGDDVRMVYGFGYCPHESHIYSLILDCEFKKTPCWVCLRCLSLSGSMGS